MSSKTAALASDCDVVSAFVNDEVGLGLVSAVGPVAAALSGVPAGRLTDRFGARRLLLSSLVQIAIGLLFLATLPRRGSRDILQDFNGRDAVAAVLPDAKRGIAGDLRIRQRILKSKPTDLALG